MYTERQIERILGKMKRLQNMVEGRIFVKAGEIDMKAFCTDGRYHEIPGEDCFAPCKKGTSFEGEGIYVWMKGSYQVPSELSGKTIYIWPRVQAYEGMLWVNGVPYGNFASKHVINTHGNHYCDMLKQDVRADENIDVAIEFYSHHFVKGTMPFTDDPQTDFRITYDSVDICLKREELSDFYFNLKIVLQMVDAIEKNSYRRAEIIKALLDIHELIDYDMDSVPWETFMDGVGKANRILKDILAQKNSASAPYAGLIGHSHMDTAWLWNRKETEKKCARTYANQINLMDQYPDYTFVQSSAYHSDIIRRMYPALFERIREKTAEGRYEPNGGVWIECDCNIPSGEYMIRQFLWGQRFTRENFGYTSDSFWLPDTFGYSASLPQIMQGCGIRYFLTTKMAWNDTNEFPYNTFYWKGIDGSKVLVHFNRTHVWPDPLTLEENLMRENGNTIKEKEVSDMRLISYGFGDGGGGPEFEMVECARRLADVEGLPRTSHTTVSAFMQRLEAGLYKPSTYSGELYLELHRGTLTNQHQIKRNNRKAEFALHNLEYLTVLKAVSNHQEATSEKTAPLINGLLINQFHDILPGTCIPSAHDDAIAEVSGILETANRQADEILAELAGGSECVTVVNPLSFDRMDTIYMPFHGSYVKGEYPQQVITDLDGQKKLAISGVKVPGFGSAVLHTADACSVDQMRSAFEMDGSRLETPYYRVIFDENGFLSSLFDKRSGRQVCGEGYALNTFLAAEDVPMEWDNWDIDADYECKLHPAGKLLTRECVANGAVEYRIRSHYQITDKTTITQDMVFYAGRPEIVFDTVMDWQEDHRLLKVSFDTNIHADYSSEEIQFGYLHRSTGRSNSIEKAKFEVSNHKYTDLSETRYGAALLNDCKYGISVEEGSMRLTLHKGGCRPDYRGDKGRHRCAYAFLPHPGSMNTENVIQPGYLFNDPSICVNGELHVEPLVSVDQSNILVETIKPAEDGGKRYIARLYEAEGARTAANVAFASSAVRVEQTNMLEETEKTFSAEPTIPMEFAPFEIKTLMVTFA